MTAELKPCPFCGGRVILDNSEKMARRRGGMSTNGGGRPVFICVTCDYGLHSGHRSRVKALKAWNTRAGEEEDE